ncbi:hypothetical protein L596_027957 [Steinernema carpocapsae]|uniref:Uncharacterized protein n=1 Tax=Steinernema carpocapsae TaxID=34508 RepID=A0A4U5LX14_STECR|nr:hypothetical protein L596_027957 [Steinernema carpocapsae]
MDSCSAKRTASAFRATGSVLGQTSATSFATTDIVTRRRGVACVTTRGVAQLATFVRGAIVPRGPRSDSSCRRRSALRRRTRLFSLTETTFRQVRASPLLLRRPRHRRPLDKSDARPVHRSSGRLRRPPRIQRFPLRRLEAGPYASRKNSPLHILPTLRSP